MPKKKTSKFWCFSNETKWHKKDFPYLACADDIADFVTELGYDSSPEVFIGDEFNFCAIFEHPDKEEYLFQIEIEDLVKIVFADSLPAMLFLMQEFNFVVNGYFRTQKLIESIKD